MAEKKQDVQIRPNEITLDQQGKIVITNPTFAKLVSEELEKMKKSGEPVTAGFISINIIC